MSASVRSIEMPDLGLRQWRSVVGDKGSAPNYWDQERDRLLALVGDLTGFSIQMNRILVAVWQRPEKTGGGIIMPNSVLEDRVQGVAGIVLLYGPQAYVSDQMMTFVESEKPPLHSWVVFRKSDGFRFPIRGAQCVVLSDEKGIKAVIPQPDLVTEG